MLYRERTRQRLHERFAHVDTNRADMAAAQSARDLAASEARKSTVQLGKSLSEGQLQKAARPHGQKCSLRGDHPTPQLKALTLTLTLTLTLALTLTLTRWAGRR